MLGRGTSITGEPHVECGAGVVVSVFLRARLKAYIAILSQHQLPRDGQTQPRAIRLVFARMHRVSEPFEHTIMRGSRDARPRIADIERDPLIVHLGADFYRPAARRLFDRVRDQVGKDLLHAHGVHLHIGLLRRVWPCVNVELHITVHPIAGVGGNRL